MLFRIKTLTLLAGLGFPALAFATEHDAQAGADPDPGAIVAEAAARAPAAKNRGPVAERSGSSEKAAKGGGKAPAKKSSAQKGGGKKSQSSKKAQPAKKAEPAKAEPAKAQPANRADSARPTAGTARGGRVVQPSKVRVQTGSKAAVKASSAERHGRPSSHVAAANFRHPSGAAPANRASASHASATRHHAVVASHRHAVTVSRHRAVLAGNHRAWASRHRAAYRHRAWVYRAPHARWYHPWAPGRPHHWYHGVFVYGPRPVVVVQGGGVSVEDPREPEREVDRTGQVSVGLRGGSYMSRYTIGGGYGDFGLGIAARYRAAEAFGFELQWQHHDQSWSSDSERTQDPIAVSAQVFAFPWSKVNPYVLAGVTVTPRDVVDQVGASTVVSGSTLWGPHGGVGLELAVGENASISLDGRWVGYLNREGDDPTYPGAFQGNLGVNFYF